jgi:flagellar biogenesis protein FliO
MVGALLVLVGLQLVVSWVLMRVLETLSMRSQRIEEEMRSTAIVSLPTLSATAAAPTE